MSKMPTGPGANMTCGFKVNTKSSGWHKSLTKILSEIKSAAYAIDVPGGMVYVIGKVDPTTILKKLNKYSKHAELCWVRTGKTSSAGVFDNYERSLRDMQIMQPPPPAYQYPMDPYHNWNNIHRPPPPMAIPRYPIPPPPVTPYVPNYGYHYEYPNGYHHDPYAYHPRNMY